MYVVKKDGLFYSSHSEWKDGLFYSSHSEWKGDLCQAKVFNSIIEVEKFRAMYGGSVYDMVYIHSYELSKCKNEWRYWEQRCT